MIEIDERAISPQALSQFLPTDHLPRPLHQCKQQLEGTLLEPDPDAVLAELACIGIYREFTELKSRDRIR